MENLLIRYSAFALAIFFSAVQIVFVSSWAAAFPDAYVDDPALAMRHAQSMRKGSEALYTEIRSKLDQQIIDGIKVHKHNLESMIKDSARVVFPNKDMKDFNQSEIVCVF